MKKLYGVVTPMITPMDNEGNVDYKSLESLATHLIKRGSDALYPCGTTGAVTYLSVEERKKIVETVHKAASGKAVIFAQVGGTTLRDTQELAHHAYKTGIDGIGLLTPIYYSLSDAELEDYYVQAAKSVPEDFPIYMYAIPGMANNDVSPALVQRIASRCKNVIGIKYSKGDISRLLAFRQINDGTFSVMVAPLEMYYAALSIGCDGIVSGTCHVFTEKIKELYTVYKAGNLKKALELQNYLFNAGKIVKDKEMAKCTALMKHYNAIATANMRAPMQELPEDEKQLLFTEMDEYNKELKS